MISLPFAAGDAASAVYAARPKYAAHCAELPFIIIQLPQWIDRATAEAHADPLDWPVIRDAQWAANREIPSVATVCTIDCGEFDNIHPHDKRTVGERTAAMALGTMHRCREIAVCGPEPLAIRAVDGSADYSADGCAGGCAGGGDGSDGSSDDSERGGAVLVRYRHAAGLRFDGTTPGTTNADGLDAVSRSAEQSGFELAGADGVFHDAAARIVPDCAVHGGKTGLFSEPGTADSAASGTTLADLDDGSYVHRLDTRLPASLPIDLFICQLSTNDASHGVLLGGADETDTHTVAGALNHIVGTVRERWNCPLVFFTGAHFDSPRYQAMVDLLFDMQRIHGFGIIDLWHDAAWNAIPDDRRALYMHDPVHPTKAGYRDWWGPEMVRQLLDLTR